MIKANGSVVCHCCKKEEKTSEELFQDEMLRAAGRADEVKNPIHSHTHTIKNLNIPYVRNR